MTVPETRNPAGLGGARNVTGNAGGKSKRQNSERKPTRQERWQAANPVARWSHVAVASAIRRGILTKPDACEACGSEGALDAHHDDHRLPLDVRWLCRSCHVQHHARQRKGGGHA